jgi:hypothetical protein
MVAEKYRLTIADELLGCCMSQYGRCTVGRLNWSPSFLNVTSNDAVAIRVAADERRTALHELLHLLGFENPLTCTTSAISVIWRAEQIAASRVIRWLCAAATLGALPVSFVHCSRSVRFPMWCPVQPIPAAAVGVHD